MRIAIGMAAAVLALAGNLAVAAPAAQAAPRPQIVVFDDLPSDAVKRLRGAGVARAAVFPDAEAAAIVGPKSALRRVRRWRDVVAFYPERRFKLSTFQTKASLGVEAIHAGGGGLGAAYTGRGVTVAVFDTGIETSHPDLDDRVAASANFEISGVLDPITDGEYSRENAETPVGFDELQHGTLVGGIVAGTGESAAGADMRGMAPEATLVNLKLIGEATHELPNDVVSETNALASYQWMLDHRNDPRFPGGIRVATNSWGWDGGDFEPAAMTNILRSAVDAGIAVVFAAGNSGPGPDTVAFPGRLPWIITVGASCKVQGVWSALCPDGAGQVADFSSRGGAVDILAPGVDIWGPAAKLGFENTVFTPVRLLTSAGSTAPPAPGSSSPADEANNRAFYLYGPGTSFAAPHVAGIVALMLQANPALGHADIEQILQSTATDLGPTGFDPDNGFGHVNALTAVQAAESVGKATPAAAPTPSPRIDGPPTCTPTDSRAVSLARPAYGVTCSEAATLSAAMTLSARDARALRLGRSRVAVASGKASAEPGHATTIKLVLTNRARKRLRGLRRAALGRLRPTIVIVARDAAGNRSTHKAKRRLTR